LEDKLGLKITGGKNGTITALKEQMWRFFTCEIAIIETAQVGESHGKAIRKMEMASDVEVWWHPRAKSQDALFESQIVLGEKFFESIIQHPVPIDWTPSTRSGSLPWLQTYTSGWPTVWVRSQARERPFPCMAEAAWQIRLEPTTTSP